jgi:hypothetical protein
MTYSITIINDISGEVALHESFPVSIVKAAEIIKQRRERWARRVNTFYLQTPSLAPNHTIYCRITR